MKERLEKLRREFFASATAPKPEDIMRAVSDHFEIPFESFQGQARTAGLSFPRQVSMMLVRELCPLSLVDVGKLHGGRDHGTVLHAIKKVKEAIDTDPKTRKSIISLRAQLYSEDILIGLPEMPIETKPRKLI